MAGNCEVLQDNVKVEIRSWSIYIRIILLLCGLVKFLTSETLFRWCLQKSVNSEFTLQYPFLSYKFAVIISTFPELILDV